MGSHVSFSQTMNVPGFVIGAAVLFAIGLNVADMKQKQKQSQIQAAKQEVVTRLLIDR